jgi:hypothetical protein
MSYYIPEDYDVNGGDDEFGGDYDSFLNSLVMKGGMDDGDLDDDERGGNDDTSEDDIKIEMDGGAIYEGEGVNDESPLFADEEVPHSNSQEDINGANEEVPHSNSQEDINGANEEVPPSNSQEDINEESPLFADEEAVNGANDDSQEDINEESPLFADEGKTNGGNEGAPPSDPQEDINDKSPLFADEEAVNGANDDPREDINGANEGVPPSDPQEDGANDEAPLFADGAVEEINMAMNGANEINEINEVGRVDRANEINEVGRVDRVDGGGKRKVYPKNKEPKDTSIPHKHENKQLEHDDKKAHTSLAKTAISAQPDKEIIKQIVQEDPDLQSEKPVIAVEETNANESNAEGGADLVGDFGDALKSYEL